MISRAGVSNKKPEKQTYEAFIMLTESERSEIVRSASSNLNQPVQKSTRDQSRTEPKKEIQTAFSAPQQERSKVQSPAGQSGPGVHNHAPPDELCSIIVRSELPSPIASPDTKDQSTTHLLRATFCKPVKPCGEEEPIFPSVSIIKSGNDINLAQNRSTPNNARRYSSVLGFGRGSIPVFQLITTFEENTTPRMVPTDPVIREEDNRNLQIDTNVDLSTILKTNPHFQQYLTSKYGQAPSLQHIHNRVNNLLLPQPKLKNPGNETNVPQGTKHLHQQ